MLARENSGSSAPRQLERQILMRIRPRCRSTGRRAGRAPPSFVSTSSSAQHELREIRESTETMCVLLTLAGPGLFGVAVQATDCLGDEFQDASC